MRLEIGDGTGWEKGGMVSEAYSAGRSGGDWLLMPASGRKTERE